MGQFLRNWANGRRHHQANHRQRLRVYRHRERQGHVFSLVKPRRRGELRRTPRRTTSVIHRRTWTERAKSRKRQAGLTELWEHSFSIPEKQIWVIREVKIKAKGNNRKRPSL